MYPIVQLGSARGLQNLRVWFRGVFTECAVSSALRSFFKTPKNPKTLSLKETFSNKPNLNPRRKTQKMYLFLVSKTSRPSLLPLLGVCSDKLSPRLINYLKISPLEAF